MYGRSPNSKERIKPLAEDPRHLDTGASGNMAQDGYTRVCRRPRVRGFDDCVPVDDADRIEDMFKPVNPVFDNDY